MPKIVDLPGFNIDPPSGLIVRVEPFLFFKKTGKIQSHHDPKAVVLVKANLYVTNGRFSLNKSRFSGAHGCRVDRRASVEINLDDPNALSEFSNGAEVLERLKKTLSEVTL